MRLFTVGAAVFLQAAVHLLVADHQDDHLEVVSRCHLLLNVYQYRAENHPHHQ